MTTTCNRLLLIIFSLATHLTFGQKSIQGLGSNPIYIIDSVKTSPDGMLKVNPNTVTLVNVISKQEALEKFGDSAKDGVVYVETINFVKRRYWDYFKSKETNKKLVKKIGDCREIKFILNETPLPDINIGKLHQVNDRTLEHFRLIKRRELKKKYSIKDKKYGVVVRAKLESK